MKKNIFFLSICMAVVTLFSCRKDNLTSTEVECLLINPTKYVKNANAPYFYDNQNRLIGRVKYGIKENAFPFDASSGVYTILDFLTTPLFFDTVVYANNLVTVYSLNASHPVDSVHIPVHQPLSKYVQKAVAEYSNGKMAVINYYRIRGTTEYLYLKKEIEYQNGKVSRVRTTGSDQTCSFYREIKQTQTDYIYNYINADSIEVLGVTKLLNGTSVGNDTLNISFQNLKNPLSKDKNLPFIYTNIVNERVIKYRKYSSSFLFPDGEICGVSYTTGVSMYSDNGKGYPIEFGDYKCN